MKYRVEISKTAFAEVDEAFEWLSARAPLAAQRWREELLKAITSLENFPVRCPLAPESESLGRGIRQLLYGKRRGIYRILFEIPGQTVYVIRVRHGARRLLGGE